MSPVRATFSAALCVADRVGAFGRTGLCFTKPWELNGRALDEAVLIPRAVSTSKHHPGLLAWGCPSEPPRSINPRSVAQGLCVCLCPTGVFLSAVGSGVGVAAS